ncbi:MAG: patatin-like phospholipase family protein [Bacteroidetes bacterium]|nr:patatin-like phospholipase family protein [Bacteroidota bacterium]
MKLQKHLFLIYCSMFAFILSSCSSSFMEIDTPKTMPPPRVLKSKPRVAVVLGGGAFLGMAHVGVLKVLEENNIPIDLIVGTSAGSFVGAMYASYPNSDTVKKIGMSIKSKEIFNASLFNSITGFVTGENLQQYITDHVKVKNIEDTQIPFVAVTTDLISGKTIALSSGPLAPSVNSSCAIPMIFEPVKMYGMILVDGGVLDGVAVDIAKTYNPDVIIAIDLMSILNTTPEVKNFIDVLARSYQIAAYRVKETIVPGADILLEPKLSQFPLLSDAFDKQVYDAGYTVAMENIDSIKAIIKRKVKE